MNARRVGMSLLAVLLLLAVITSFAQAQDPDGRDELQRDQQPIGVEIFEEGERPPVNASIVPAPQETPPDVGINALLSDAIPIQGQLTNAAGVPLNGAYNITRALYDVASGDAPLCSSAGSVSVNKGLFVTSVTGCGASVFDGRQLYLGIKVGADAEMTPRQAIYANAYARGLRPGAIINQTDTTARGLTVRAVGSGAAGTALWVSNAQSASGVGLWSTVAGSDAAIVASNNGTGAIFKGFGNNGGEDEFRINNNGAIETQADSYIFVPGSALVKNISSDTTRWDIQSNGAARIWRGAASGPKVVYYPIIVPTVLYGREVRVESITIHYLTTDGASAYIDATYLDKHTGANGGANLIVNGDNRTSTTATSYTLSASTINNVLSAQQGLSVMFDLAFSSDWEYVQIGGISIRLSHHSLP